MVPDGAVVPEAKLTSNLRDVVPLLNRDVACHRSCASTIASGGPPVVFVQVREAYFASARLLNSSNVCGPGVIQITEDQYAIGKCESEFFPARRCTSGFVH